MATLSAAIERGPITITAKVIAPIAAEVTPSTNATMLGRLPTAASAGELVYERLAALQAGTGEIEIRLGKAHCAAGSSQTAMGDAAHFVKVGVVVLFQAQQRKRSNALSKQLPKRFSGRFR